MNPVQQQIPVEQVPAVLVHGGELAWRRHVHDALRGLPLRVLLSAREAEAAKCLRDPQLVLLVAVDAQAIRTTLGALRPELPVLWVRPTEATASQDRLQLAAGVLARLPVDSSDQLATNV